MNIDEYNEVRWPTRALQQEEEEDAVAQGGQDVVPPTVQWVSPSDAGAAATPASAGPLLIVGTSPASCALLRAALGPDSTPAGFVGSSSSSGTKQQLYRAAPSVLVCCCDGAAAVPPQRAPAWARGVLQALQPGRLLVLGALQLEQYRGEADASQELLAFVLRSSAAREEAKAGSSKPVAPYLPSGSIAAGLQAALLTRAELLGLPAELLLVVEQVPSLVPETLQQLAGLVAGALGSAGGGAGDEKTLAAQLASGPVVESARSTLHKTAYRPSAVYS